MNIDEKLEESIENKYMKDDKGKNKMELTIEESVYILKRKDFNTYVEDKAIETLLTAYEKEKEKNKELENDYVAKDKIRLKMKQEMDKGYRLSEERHLQNYAYDRLKELLEEE